ncbi:MAG: hypothetical protein SOH60_07970 [Lachnospiraceae bacterium]|jgi:hypothetical protein
MPDDFMFDESMFQSMFSQNDPEEEKKNRRHLFLLAAKNDTSAFQVKFLSKEDIEKELEAYPPADDSSFEQWANRIVQRDAAMAHMLDLTTCRYLLPDKKVVFMDIMPESKVAKFEKRLEEAAPGARVIESRPAGQDEFVHYLALHCYDPFEDDLNGLEDLEDENTDDVMDVDSLFLSPKMETLFRVRLNLEESFFSEYVRPEYIEPDDVEEEKAELLRAMKACRNEYTYQYWKALYLEEQLDILRREKIYAYTFGDPGSSDDDQTEILNQKSFEMHQSMSQMIGVVLKSRRTPTDDELRHYACAMAISNLPRQLREDI